MTRLNVAGLLREPPGAEREVRLSGPDWRDPRPEGGRPLVGSLRLQRTNRGLLVSGEVRTVVRRTCMRCLDEFDEPVTVPLSEEFLLSVDPTSGAAIRIEPEDADLSRIDAHHELDLGPLLAEELTLAEPMRTLCRPDCRGLCPVCGRRLDEGDHAHPDAEVDPRLARLADWLPPDE